MTESEAIERIKELRDSEEIREFYKGLRYGNTGTRTKIRLER